MFSRSRLFFPDPATASASFRPLSLARFVPAFRECGRRLRFW